MNRDFFEYAPDGLAIIDEDFSILYSNQKFRSCFKDVSKITDINFLDRKTKIKLSSFDFNEYFKTSPSDIEALYINENEGDSFFSISYNSFMEDNQRRLCVSFKNITNFLYYVDIFEQLYNGMSTQTIKLDNLIKEKEEINKELKKRDNEIHRQLLLAQDIQKKLFPPIRTLFGNYEIASKIIPASKVSGDLVFFAERDQSHLDIIVADVTGHGIPSALMTMLLRTSLQNAINAKLSPVDVLKKVNNDLYEIFSNAGLFATIMYCQIDILCDEITIFNCSHPAPFHLQTKKINLDQKDSGGMMLGITEELEFDQKVSFLDIGDFLFIITDGVTEAINENGDFFENTFSELLLDISKNHADFTPIQAIRFLLNKLNIHIGNQESFSDDVTIICIKKIKEKIF
jgi:serine phosphatase RsbU (regulator of sigma subunit)